MEPGPRAGKEVRRGAWEKMQSGIAEKRLNRLAALQIQLQLRVASL